MHRDRGSPYQKKTRPSNGWSLSAQYRSTWISSSRLQEEESVMETDSEITLDYSSNNPNHTVEKNIVNHRANVTILIRTLKYSLTRETMPSEIVMVIKYTRVKGSHAQKRQNCISTG